MPSLAGMFAFAASPVGSLPPNQPDPCRKGPSLLLAEGPKLRRVNHVVHLRRISAAGRILHHASQSPILPAKMKLPFQARTEVHKLREPPPSGRADHLLCRI